MINNVSQARLVFGVDELRFVMGDELKFVMGGFHLAFMAAAEKIDKTVAALKELDAKQVVPMVCRGFKCIADVARGMPNAFFQYAVGTRINFGQF